MPKKAKSAKKVEKIAVLSDSDGDDDDFKRLKKKKGHKIAISDSSDDDDDGSATSKSSTSQGKIHSFLLEAFIVISRFFWSVFDGFSRVLQSGTH